MPRKLELNVQTQEILLLLSGDLSLQEIANICGVSRMWVYSVAKREMKRAGTTDRRELLTRFCEQQLQRAQEMRIAAEKLIRLAEDIEATNFKLLNKVHKEKEMPSLENEVSITLT